MTEHKWFQKFGMITALPFMQYIVMKHRSPIEKLFWILAYIFMISTSWYAICFLLNLWIHSPIVNYIENSESSIQDIPFPTLKICSSNQMRRWIWERYENTNTSYWYSLQHYHSLVCNSRINKIISNQLALEHHDFEWFQNFLNDCAISCSEVFRSDVKWQNTTIKNICRFVQPMITSLGVCYNVNMIPSSQLFTDKYQKRYMHFFSKNHTYVDTDQSSWNIDVGYSNYLQDNISMDVTPARTSGVGYYSRFKLRLHAPERDFMNCPNSPFADGDYLIGFANPSDFYKFETRSFFVPYSSTKIQITPIVKKISSDLKWRSQEIRKCFFHNERKLSVFQHYSEANCRYECILNVTAFMCGCLNIESSPFGTTGIKICGLAKKDCVRKAIKAAAMSEKHYNCNCLPSCNTIDYDILSSPQYESREYLETTNLLKNDSRGATIEVVFKYPYFTAYISGSVLNIQSLINFLDASLSIIIPIFTVLDFTRFLSLIRILGNVGGILSLFLGLNIINMFEMLYVVIKIFSCFIARLLEK